MKYKIIITLAFIFFAFFGCGGDDGGNSNPVNPGGIGIGGGGGNGGGNNNGNVTFTVNATQDQDGVYFNFVPSVNVTVTTVTASLPSEQFEDVIQGDGTTVYDTQNGFSIGSYTGVQSGQAWTFKVEGKVESANGTAYSKSVNYTVP